MNIRPARLETDLPAIQRITSPYETTPLTEDQMREFFAFNPPGRIQVRLVAADDRDRVSAYAGGVHETTAPDGYFKVWVMVDPAQRRQGIGSKLWEALLHALEEKGGRRLEVEILEAEPDSLAFAELTCPPKADPTFMLGFREGDRSNATEEEQHRTDHQQAARSGSASQPGEDRGGDLPGVEYQ
jgi:GNAT superfamily N-acetyltransferase